MHIPVLVGFGIPGVRVLGWISTAMAMAMATATAMDLGSGAGILGFGNYILGGHISRRMLMGGLYILCQRE